MKTIAVFVHQPKCSIQSGNGLIKALTPYYRFKVFTKHELEDSFFDDVDMVAFPGGVGDADSWDNLLKSHVGRIRKFVNHGGRYLGVCMGAYWAGSHYFNLVPDIKTYQYIRRPNTCTRRYYSKAVECNWNGKPDRFFFYDGPTFEGQFETVATYKNGDPMTIMNGNIGLIGCHLESEHYWYDKKYLNPHWHSGRHHKLLLDFVNKLMEN